MRRAVFTEIPRQDDYVLGSTGFTWTVDRARGDGSVWRISAGERSRAVALRLMRTLAERDGTDAWVGAGIGSYQLIARHRHDP